MRIQKVVNETFGNSPKKGAPRTKIAGEVSAVVSANVGEDSTSEPNRVSSRQRVRIVQKSGKTIISRSNEARGGNDDR